MHSRGLGAGARTSRGSFSTVRVKSPLPVIVPAGLLLASLAAFAAFPASPVSAGSRTVDREFAKVERRLYGQDAGLRTSCGAPATGYVLEDEPVERERSIELRRSTIRFEGGTPAELRPCLHAIARAGILDGWRLARADRGGFRLEAKLVRARRDPRFTGRRAREKTDKEAVEALTGIWKDRRPGMETLAPELVAPDVAELLEARWYAGNLSIHARAADEGLARAYRGLVEPLLPEGPRVEWRLEADRPDVPEPPEMPEDGLLRIALSDAPMGAALRLFAELDRREFVVPTPDGRRSGAIAGGWRGLVEKLADDLGRAHLRVGDVDVLAPAGTRAPRDGAWNGARVSLDLEAVPGEKVATLLAAAGDVRIDAPALPPTDLRLRRTPWDQALHALAAAHGCAVDMEPAAPKARYALRCTKAAGSAPRAVPESHAAKPPSAGTDPVARTEVDESADEDEDADEDASALERWPAWKLRVVALGARGGETRWRAIVETPDGLHVLVRTGTRLGLESGQAVVDENGVSIVLERIGPDGAPRLSAARLPF